MEIAGKVSRREKTNTKFCLRLHTENPSSSISELFYGDFISEVRCLTCNYLSTRRDKFMDLSLPIPDNSLSSTTTSSKTSFTTIGAALSSSSSSRQQPQGISAESSSQHSIYLHGKNESSTKFVCMCDFDSFLLKQDCLKSMLEEEVLGEHDLYNCPKCKSMQRCAKKLTIGHLPHVRNRESIYNCFLFLISHYTILDLVFAFEAF